MKDILLLFILFLFTTISLSAQKNDISVDFRYIPCGDCYGIGGSINYFKYISKNTLIGIKVNGNETVDNSEYSLNRRDFMNFWSFVYKKDFYSKGRSNWGLDMGLLLMLEMTYYSEEPIFGRCGTGISENYKPKKILFNHWLIESDFGITSAISYHYMIINSLYIGMELQINTIYDHGEIMPSPMPSIRFGGKF